MADRSHLKAQARAEREAAAAAAQAAQTRRARLLLAAGAVIALLVVGGGALAAGLLGSSGPGPRPGPSPVRPASIPLQRLTDLDAAVTAAGGRTLTRPYRAGISEHTNDPVRYATNPPVSGAHAFVWATDGSYAGRATPPTEQLVHALEHGRVEIQYRPGLPAAQVAQLQALYEESPRHVLLFENRTGMRCDVAVTAWSHGVQCPSFSPAVFDVVRTFRDTFRDKGPELVP